MGLYQVTVDSQANSIVQQMGGGGVPAIIQFREALNPGDVLTFTCPLIQMWNSGGGPGNTNADGVAVNMGPPISIDWTTFNPARPAPDSSSTLPFPNAANYSFGIGCLVGSLDGGTSFFAIGTDFTLTNLGNGLGTSAPTALWLFYWDINADDNRGSMTVYVSLTRRAS